MMMLFFFYRLWLIVIELWVNIILLILFMQYLLFSSVQIGLNVWWIDVGSFGCFRYRNYVMMILVSVSYIGRFDIECRFMLIQLWNFLVILVSVGWFLLMKIILLNVMLCWKKLLNSIGLIVIVLMIIDGIVSRISGIYMIYGVLCGLCVWLL